MTGTEHKRNTRQNEHAPGLDLLQAVREMKSATFVRKTEWQFGKNGEVTRTEKDSTGKCIKKETFTGARWQLIATRARMNVTQVEMAELLGVNKRTLENWEQGRSEMNATGQRLLWVINTHPEIIPELRKQSRASLR